MKWWQKEIRGHIVGFWVTDTPLVSKRMSYKDFSSKVINKLRKNR